MTSTTAPLSSAPSTAVRFSWRLLTLIALIAGLVIGYANVLRPWLLNWGSTPEETRMSLPGDELTPTALRNYTRALTIHAPAEKIWPWLIQMGADRAGLYSYTWLEKAIACPQENADSINPAWQSPQVGDKVLLCPDPAAPPAYEIAQIVPNQAFILGHRAGPADGLSEGAWAETWGFILVPVDANTTRLVIRTRSQIDPAWMTMLEPGVFIMERGMMLGIQQRAQDR